MQKTKILLVTLSATLGAVGLTACDAAKPPASPAPPAPVVTEVTEVPASEAALNLVLQDLAEALHEQDAYARARKLATLLPTLGPDTVSVAKTTLEDQMLHLGAGEREMLLRYWATHQPEDAVRWAKDKSVPVFQYSSLLSALSAWAETDPETAAKVAWAWSVDSPTLESAIPIALIRGWYVHGSIPALRKFLAGLPPGVPRQRAIAAYIRIVLQREGSEPAIAWAEELDDDDKAFKLAVFRRVVDALSMMDTDAGVRWCEIHCAGPYGKNMRSLISRNWATHDGPAAMAWLATADEGYERDLAVRLTYGKWALVEREAAKAWMKEKTSAGEPEPWLKSTYPIYARLIVDEAPLEAISWAERVESEHDRLPLLITLTRWWRQNDEAAAEAWLAESPLSEQDRDRARVPMARPPGA